jgi:hypothetical protein
VSEYIFKLKKGDLELELKSDDARFIEIQMDNWRNALVQVPATQGQVLATK